MSSSIFSAELRPDLALRRVVLLSGGVLATVGVLLLASMPFHPLARTAASVGWLLCCAWELLTVRRGFTACLGLRVLANGKVLRLDPDGHWHPARLLPGSLLLRRAGWLVLDSGQGVRFVEPIRGGCRQSNDWRRLQVIWRHIGAAR